MRGRCNSYRFNRSNIINVVIQKVVGLRQILGGCPERNIVVIEELLVDAGLDISERKQTLERKGRGIVHVRILCLDPFWRQLELELS